jgi:threonine dehydratase
VLIAVGGGGLIGGVAMAYDGQVALVAVEPELAPTLHDARHAGHPVDAAAGGIAADSLAPKRIGELTFPLAQKYVRDVVLVPDDAIRDAQRALWNVARIVAEPGAAAALAALLTRRYEPKTGERVAVVICGGNTDAVTF